MSETKGTSYTWSKYQHLLSNNDQERVTLQGKEMWRPAVPGPLFVGWGLKKPKCGCGRIFKTLEDYHAHYIYQAVWQNESNYIPKLLQPPKLKTPNER